MLKTDSIFILVRIPVTVARMGYQCSTKHHVAIYQSSLVTKHLSSCLLKSIKVLSKCISDWEMLDYLSSTLLRKNCHHTVLQLTKRGRLVEKQVRELFK